MQKLRKSCRVAFAALLVVSAAAVMMVILGWTWLGVGLLVVEGAMALGACQWMGQGFHRLSAATEQAESAGRAEVLRSQATMRAVIDSLPHGIAVVSPEGRIEIVNSRAEWFGMKSGELLADSPHPWLRRLVDEAMRSREEAAPKPTGNGEALVQMFEEGRELFFLPQAAPLINEREEVVGATVVLVDVTGARRIEEAKSNLISSFSHELKTPMTSIKMSLYLLLDDAANRLTPRQLELLTTARDDGDRLHRVLEEILMAAREKW